MCGIGGFFFRASISTGSLLHYGEKLLDSLSPRGPDSSGTWHDDNNGIVFVHSRLAILDLSSSGHQPMTSMSGRYILIFNGEIYNHTSLRHYLSSCPGFHSRWVSDSDTETLLESCEFLGVTAVLPRLNGMFAFCLYDKLSHSFYLARDHFGQKPLYYGNVCIDGIDSFFFSSDLSFLSYIKSSKPSFSSLSVTSYFSQGYISSPNSIYSDINQLSPGSIYISSLSHVRSGFSPSPHIWWDLRKHFHECRSNLFTSFESSLDNIADTLEKSVSRQMISDVPICSFLSGGIDSSLISYYANKSSNHPLSTISASFKSSFRSDNILDESAYSQTVAKAIGSLHFQLDISANDILSEIPNSSRVFSEPFADYSHVPTRLLCKAAKSMGFDVALTGDGADELFAGYYRHIFAQKFIPLLSHLPSPFLPILRSLLSSVSRSSNPNLQRRYQKLALSLSSVDNINALYNYASRISQSNFVLNPSFSFHEHESQSLSPLDHFLLSDLTTYLPSNILTKSDRCSMSSGLEARAPFLDHHLASVVWRTPPEFLFYKSSLKSKRILRTLLNLYFPTSLFNRPKCGFTMPLANWLRGPLYTWASDLLNTDLINRGGILSSRNVHQLWSEHLSERYDHSSALWAILMWQSFCLDRSYL